jgi:hypothetical protein
VELLKAKAITTRHFLELTPYDVILMFNGNVANGMSRNDAKTCGH